MVEHHSMKRSCVSIPLLLVGMLAACEGPTSDDAESGELRGLEDGLLLHWTFEDSVGTQVTDVSGNNRHGTLNGATLVDSPNGKSALLDGVDDWIAMTSPPRAPALYGGVDGSFTLSALVKVSNASRYNTLCVGCGPFSTMYVGTEPFGAALLTALDDQTSTAWRWLTSSAALSNDGWKQVTLVVENGSSARYYLDCDLDAQLDTPNLGLIDVGSSSIGRNTNASRWFGGEIDELRVWNRALDDAEIAQLCPTPDPLDVGLEMHWTFEDRVGNSITDVSGKGRTGTVVGGAGFVNSFKGQAISLDGIDDRVTFTGPRALDLYGGSSGDMTFTARVRVPNVVKYNTLCIGCGPFSTMYVGDPSPGARVLSSVWNLNTNAAIWAASTAMLTNDVWSEVTLVIEGGVAARTYENCSLNSTLSGNIGLRDGGFSALGQGNLAGRWYQGEVDEVRVWSRALPDEEIALLCQRNSICEGPIYVDADAAAGGDGYAWSSAFNNLQSALDAAASCAAPQLWVAEGQYAPNSAQSVATITRSVEIYGGFAGTEEALSQRDVAAHPTRLGGDDWLARVVAIGSGYTNVRLDGFSIVNSDKGAIDIDSDGGSSVVLANLTITDNATDKGAAVYAHGTGATLTITDSAFERNTVTTSGGALFVTGTPTQISNSSFVDNVAKLGGAIHLREPAASHQLTDNTFDGNAADWGGAIHLDDDATTTTTYVQLDVSGGEFIGNTAAVGGAGAIYLEESTCTLDGVAFVDNVGKVAGAIQLASASASVVNDELAISGSRFIGNDATNGSGGALRLLEVGTTVVNTEFAANTATTVGGGVYGRADFVGATFANNTATTAGAAVYAPAGPDMTMQHCVVYPDSIWGSNIQAPYSCTKTNTLLGAPQTLLANQTPFAAADLDLDGRTEWYLDPAGPCTGLADGAIDEFEWASLTVEASQCTDAGWPEPGVHYEPQSAAGVCE